jgi:two-component system NtrC family sensor kinase
MLRTTGNLNQKQSLFANRITNVVSHITDLIDNLLDLSTIELGVDPNVTVVDIGALTARVIADFQEQAHRRQQQLTYHPVDRPVPVEGNPLRLKQVVSNLIDNALKYTPNAGQISTIVQVEDNQVWFKVEDSGVGIPPADLPFVFDKFFRVKARAQNDTHGTGLGLAICKSIIEKYGGHIWVESQPGHGSVFIFTLPIVSKKDTATRRAPAFEAQGIPT